MKYFIWNISLQQFHCNITTAFSNWTYHRVTIMIMTVGFMHCLWIERRYTKLSNVLTSDWFNQFTSLAKPLKCSIFVTTHIYQPPTCFMAVKPEPPQCFITERLYQVLSVVSKLVKIPCQYAQEEIIWTNQWCHYVDDFAHLYLLRELNHLQYSYMLLTLNTVFEFKRKIIALIVSSILILWP